MDMEFYDTMVLFLLKTGLKGFPLTMKETGITCDTEDSNSWTTRITNMTWGQVISL